MSETDPKENVVQ